MRTYPEKKQLIAQETVQIPAGTNNQFDNLDVEELGHYDEADIDLEEAEQLNNTKGEKPPPIVVLGKADNHAEFNNLLKANISRNTTETSPT